MARTQRLFSVTICATRKPGMGEDEYHRYISEIHAPLLKRLLVEKKIVDYTMQHNTSALMKDLPKLYPNLPAVKYSPYDALVTIVFRDPQDYIDVKNDAHFVNVVNPDHKNFSGPEGTYMAYGWFEKHVSEGQLVEKVPEAQEVIVNGIQR